MKHGKKCMCPGTVHFTKHTNENSGATLTSFFNVLLIITPLILSVLTPASSEKHCQA